MKTVDVREVEKVQNTGYNNTTLKQQNRGLILKLIVTGECESRIELAKRTGLSKMAVTNIISEFMEQNLVEEKECVRIQGKGRNPIKLCLSSKAPKMIGVHIYRGECSVILCDFQLHILQRRSFPVTEENHGRLLEYLFQEIDEILDRIPRTEICGIGIGALGPVDVGKGRILNPPNFYGMKNIDIVSVLKERYDMPVFFDSQYDGAALAEKFFGNGRDVEDFVFVGLANGIGSGIISQGTIYRDYSGFTSELGHVSIDWNGRVCSCGRKGCLETYISSPVIARKLCQITGWEKSFREFCQINLSEYAKEADQVLEDMMEKLACGIVNLTNLFNPQKVIIGHEGYWIPDKYICHLENDINERKLLADYHQIRVEKSYFGEDAHIIGCACSLLTEIFAGRIV
mgnify:FL=1